MNEVRDNKEREREREREESRRVWVYRKVEKIVCSGRRGERERIED
jgi:hypothetical protein